MKEAWLAGLSGLLVGSFLNVCIYRLPRDLSVVRPRSHCPHCQRTLAWQDLAPVVSWLRLRGRCRWCRAPIAPTYPLVELLTGVLFFWSVYSRGANILGVKLCVFAAILVALIFTDFADRILPDEFTVGGFLCGLGLAPFTPAPSSLLLLAVPSTWPTWGLSLGESLVGGIGSAGLLWLVAAIYSRVRGREGLGFGDVKMMLAVGAFLGLPGALATIFIGSVLGSVLGSIYLLATRQDMSRYELPFGSFLAIGALLVGLFGEPLFAWYWGLGG